MIFVKGVCMGMLVDGKWITGSIINPHSGKFIRPDSPFRIMNKDIFKDPKPGRFRLYVSYACPWAHRCLVVRQLKNLTTLIPISVVCPDMLEYGWTFSKKISGTTGDDLFDYKYLYQIYQKSSPEITTKVTVPLLFDSEHNSIVNNESSDIIKIFNAYFPDYADNSVDIFPDKLQKAIHDLTTFIYDNINNGVYKVGFANTQQAYDIAVKNLFLALDKIDALLADRQYLHGDVLTASDIYLMPTLLRFDLVYYVHFKCNLRHIMSYKNIFSYMQRLYDMAIFKDTTDFSHIKRHYYYSHTFLNPSRIIPIGPDIFI